MITKTKRDNKNGNKLHSAWRDADLAASGLSDPKVIKKLQIGPMLSLEKTRENTGITHAISYEIPYFDLAGQRIDYKRWKMFATKGELGFKYYQQEKTIPRLYLPPLVNWTKIAADTSQRIVITEGEKKAACGCLHKLNAIGLGGVWSWRAAKWWLDNVKDFDELKWHGREVEICFDGDLYSNENVSRAMGAFIQRLAEKFGAKVFILARQEPQPRRVGDRRGVSGAHAGAQCELSRRAPYRPPHRGHRGRAGRAP